jgi:putative spermidine/putrescine transport system substrate-binding protein
MVHRRFRPPGPPGPSGQSASARHWRNLVAIALATLAAMVVVACGSSDDESGSTSAASTLPQSIGRGEGELNLIAWEGYTQPQWVRPFEQQTGCSVNAKYAGSSDEMVTLMRQGGGSQYDMVSASGDASVRLIRGGDVAPVNVALIPSWNDFVPQLKSPAHNTVDGKHYGVSLQWGPNTLLYNTDDVRPRPTSWSTIYDPRFRGQVTVPDNPIQIADAALYLSRTRPELGIEDPYALTPDQLDAATDLLKQQRPLIQKYWSLASDEIDLFKNADAVVGASWPYQTITLQDDGTPVADTIPREGATGWADTWMLSSQARHPNCAYEWMRWISTPRVQAQQAIYFGETPANTRACAFMDRMQRGSCAKYHANESGDYFDSIHFWRTPTSDCGDGRDGCTDYNDWQQKWTEVKG